MIFTKSDGTTLIEDWVEGEKVETERDLEEEQEERREETESSAGRNEIGGEEEEGSSIVGRGGARSGSWADVITPVATVTLVTMVTLVITLIIFIFTEQPGGEETESDGPE